LGVAVRKTVTVLFCDLVGSTALGDQTDPEVLQEAMSRYHAELRTILERHGGTVEKFVGDAAMAVFGLPDVHEDDALRALRAAQEIQDRVKTLNLDVRIGLNTGEVVAGAGETLVTGDAVNVAARLEQAGRRGEILLGQGTERLVREAASTEPLEPLELKGKAEPVPAYRLLELLPDVPAFTRPIEAPFVGREQELEALERTLRAAVDTREPQLATVVGPPGIGKSRLIRELIQRSQARVLVGRCLSYGEGITYWPLQEIAMQIGDLVSATGDELASARVTAALGEGSASSEEIAWGFRKLFEALAQERPLIVVLDDIHWAEQTLLDLIEYVAAFGSDAPLFLLCSARPDLFDSRPAWATPKPNAVMAMLDPLPDEQTKTLVEELRDLPAEAKARIVEAAEGNPLFVEQLVAYQAENGNGHLEIPPTIQALLAARIDRLEPDERSVIERASIEGRLFHRGSIQELLPEAERDGAGAQLMTLVRKELIRPDRSQLPGDDGFRFGHILIRDAAYDSIPKRLRAELHERFGKWLESKLEDASPEIVGYHLEQAYRYGAELGRRDAGLGERAAERLASGAGAARARRDGNAATNLLERAIELSPRHGATRRELLVELAIVRADAADFARAKSLFAEARSLAEEAGDAHVQWRARVGLAELQFSTDPEGGAETCFREARAAIAAREMDGDHQVLAEAWFLIGQAHLMRAQGEEQIRAALEARRHARDAGDRMLEIEIIMRSAPPFVFGPVPVEDGFRYVEGVVGELGENPAGKLFAQHVLGHMHARLGEFESARAEIDEFRTQFRELGQELMYLSTSACAWDVCWHAEDWIEGERVLREAEAELEQRGEKAYRSTVAYYLADALYAQGRLDEAEPYCELSKALGASDDHVTQGGWRAVLAKILAARDAFDEAEALARHAVEIASKTDALDFRGQVALDLSTVLTAAGRPEEARGVTEEALAFFERKGNLVGAERARRFL
jgi:class 3 adenylate cyclase/tetratricopeptide (TPR) repeat protein